VNTIPTAPQLDIAQTSLLSSSSYKRSVLSSFTDVLLLPVTIVPRTVVATANSVSGAAVQGIAMLDPRRWGAEPVASPADYHDKYRRHGDANPVIWASEDDEDDADEKADERTIASNLSGSTKAEDSDSKRKRTYDNLQLLLSLDVTLELIHASRESLKRVETFAGYPGTYGSRVRETIEEVAAEMLMTLGARHLKPGFELAIAQMRTHQPPSVEFDGSEEKEKTISTSVAPLVQFFELVHIGDMIQSIVQVYFDKELVRN
jgi:recyclin-1